jgi:hypothetical protein
VQLSIPSAEVFPKLKCSFLFVFNFQKIIVRSTTEGCSASVLKSIYVKQA